MSQSSTKQKLQREKVSQFISLTQSSEKNAVHFLTQYDWKLDVATDAYYTSLDSYSTNSGSGGGSGSSSSGGNKHNSRESSRVTVDKKKLEQIWAVYKGK